MLSLTDRKTRRVGTSPPGLGGDVERVRAGEQKRSSATMKGKQKLQGCRLRPPSALKPVGLESRACHWSARGGSAGGSGRWPAKQRLRRVACALITPVPGLNRPRCRSVAQPGSAHRSGRWGRRFESSHSDQQLNGSLPKSLAEIVAIRAHSSSGNSTKIKWSHQPLGAAALCRAGLAQRVDLRHVPSRARLSQRQAPRRRGISWTYWWSTWAALMLKSLQPDTAISGSSLPGQK